MVSEVNGPGSGSIKPVVGQTSKVESAARPQAPGATASADSDVVTLTDLAARLQALAKSIEQLPEVDRQRVAELKQAIADGSYEVDDESVAEKLAAFEAQLQGSDNN